MNEIVAILSHADTQDKIDVLIRCIDEIKKQNYKIIVSSHIEIPNKIKKEVDYIIIEKENPLIFSDEFPNSPNICIWQRYPSYKQNHFLKFNHSFAVLKLIKNALGLSLANSFDKIHFVNYDYVLRDPNVLLRHSQMIGENDLFSYYYDKFDSERRIINTGLFSVKTSKILEIFKDINTKNQFLDTNEAVFERYFYKKCIENNIKIYLDNQEDLLNTTSILNSKSTYKNVINDSIYIYLSKENNTEDYYIYIKTNDIINLTVNLRANNIQKVWKPVPININLLKIPISFLNEGIEVEIPEIKFKESYDRNTNFAHCEIIDRIIIQEWHQSKKYTIESYINSKFFRYDIINYLIEKNNYKKYLEIGVHNGDNIRRIKIESKDGVDPGSEGEISEFTNYRITSDDFFKKIDANTQYDIIFIDGLHHSEQVDKDIINSLNHLGENGIIILHDCNPPDYKLQVVPRISALWNGDVWKSIVNLRCNRPDLEVCVVDTDWGLGVVRKGTQNCLTEKMSKYLDWNYFSNNREEILNMISVEQFFSKY